MKIMYLGGLSETRIEGVGIVQRGGTIDCPKEIAEMLVKRNPKAWELVKKGKKEKGVD